MTTFKYLTYDVYYETHGEGRPLIILNGIMMSTASWDIFIDALSQNNQCILVDFLDQGQSSHLDTMTYTHEIQVELVHALAQHLNLTEISLFGISYGGEIALQYALKYPEKLEKLLLFNTTAWTSPWLEEIGNAWNLASYDPYAYYATTIPVIYSPGFYNSNQNWIQARKETLIPIFSDSHFMQAMVRLTNSSTEYDVRDRVHEISLPTLIVSSEFDFVTPTLEQEYLARKIKDSTHILLPNIGHASMYENPELFLTLVLGFVNKQNGINII